MESSLSNKPKPVAIEKQKYIKLAQEIQKIVAQEKVLHHAK